MLADCSLSCYVNKAVAFAFQSEPRRRAGWPLSPQTPPWQRRATPIPGASPHPGTRGGKGTHLPKMRGQQERLRAPNQGQERVGLRVGSLSLGGQKRRRWEKSAKGAEEVGWVGKAAEEAAGHQSLSQGIWVSSPHIGVSDEHKYFLRLGGFGAAFSLFRSINGEFPCGTAC